MLFDKASCILVYMWAFRRLKRTQMNRFPCRPKYIEHLDSLYNGKMALFKLLSFLTLALSTGKCRAASPVIPTVQVRNAPGMSVEDTHLAIRHGLAAASLGKRKDYTGNQTLAKSWSGATLLSMSVRFSFAHEQVTNCWLQSIA
jgi:hypothetical protein